MDELTDEVRVLGSTHLPQTRGHSCAGRFGDILVTYNTEVLNNDKWTGKIKDLHSPHVDLAWESQWWIRLKLQLFQWKELSITPAYKIFLWQESSNPTCFSHTYKEQCLKLSRTVSWQGMPQGFFSRMHLGVREQGEAPSKWLVPAGPHPIICLEHPGFTLSFFFQLMLSKVFHIPSIFPSVWVTHRSVLIPDLHSADN